MNCAIRRRPNRLRLEVLEGRLLLSGAGTPDPSFGAGTGYAAVSLGLASVHNPFLGEGVTGDSVATLPDGNIAVTGTVTITTSNPSLDSTEIVITEFNPNGTVDSSFGTDGLVKLPASFDGSYATVALPGGKLLVAGGLYSSPGFVAVRLNANGSVDSTFGTDGLAEYPAGTTTSADGQLSTVVSALLQSNGQIVLVGLAAISSTSSEDFAAVRLNSDGSIDTTYGTNGTADIPVTVNGFTMDSPTAAAIQANGQVVVTGNVKNGSIPSLTNPILTVPATEVAVVRLNTDGSLDTTFGGSTAAGIVLLPAAPDNPTLLGQNESSGIAVDSTTGNVLVSGNDQDIFGASSTIEGPTLYQLNTDGTPDTGFGTGGLVRPGVSGSVAVQSNGQIVVAGNLNYTGLIQDSGLVYSAGVIRLDADGLPDATFGNTTTPGLFQAQSPNLTQVAGLSIQPDGDILLAGDGTTPSVDGRNFALTVTSLLPAARATQVVLTTEDAPADFDGAGYTDLALYNPSAATFTYRSPTLETGTIPFGIAGAGQTIPALADYLGNGQDQIAAYLSASGVYAILPTSSYTSPPSTGSPGLFMQFGIPGAGQSIPTPADFEGTGKADVAIYMPSLATFAILPSDGAPGYTVPFGQPGLGNSIPAPADYFNTGQADIAVYLTEIGAFAIRNPATGKDTIIPFGKPGAGQSIPVPGDYDGSGKTELAVYIPSLGAFFYRPADGGKDVEVAIGPPGEGEIPVPGDYDGAGYDEFAVYDPLRGVFLYKPADGGPAVIEYYGTANSGAIPVAASAATLSEMGGSGSGGGGNAIRPSFVPSGSSGSASTAAITLSTASAVPAGPTLASVRVARSLVNQAAPDPLDLD